MPDATKISSITPQKTLSNAASTVAVKKSTSATKNQGKSQNVIKIAPVSGATSYNVYVLSSPTQLLSTAQKIVVTDATNATAVHDNLVPGQTYYYVVTSVNGASESVPSTISGTKILANVNSKFSEQSTVSFTTTSFTITP